MGGWDDRRFQWPHLWWLGGGGWIVVCGLLALGFMLLLWSLWSLWLLLLLSVLLLVVVAVADVASAAAFGGASGRAAGNGVSASGA